MHPKKRRQYWCHNRNPVNESILGHSCLLNLCLEGGGGCNCLAIYAGSKFVLNPLENIRFTAVVDTFSNVEENRGSIVPPLLPSYPGTIIGGTGLFAGAVGYVDVTTITGSTLTPAGAIIDGPVFNAKFPQAGYITQNIQLPCIWGQNDICV
jgi:hypothetical protein